MKTRAVALIFSASSAVWIVLGVFAVPRLHLASITLAAASVIVAVQAASLLYALRISLRAHLRGFAGAILERDAVERELDHLGWLAQFCQILGLLGTVAGFMLELRTLGSVHGAIDPGTAVSLVGQMARGFGTALTSTFAGILASVVISLAQHVLDA